MSPTDPEIFIPQRDILTRAPHGKAVHPSRHQARARGMQFLFFCLLCLGMGQSLFFAVLPPVARDLGLSESETGIIFSLSALLWIFCSPLWGRQSDKWGRKPVILIGIIGFASSTFFIAFILFLALHNLLAPLLILPLLIMARALFGTFGSGSMPAAQAYVADRTLRKDRAPAISSLTAAFGIGNIVGPGFAAVLIGFGFLVPFVAISIAALLGSLALAFTLPESFNPKRSRNQQDQNVRLREMGTGFLFLVLMGLMASFAQAVLIQLSAFHFMDRLELAAAEATQMIGIALMAMAMAALFAQLVLIQRFYLSVRTLLRGGALAMICAFLGLAFAQNYASLVFSLILAGFGFGLLRPGLMTAASLLTNKKRQGVAAGFLGATAAFGHVINPFTGMVIYQYYPAIPFLLCALTMLIFLLVALLQPQIRTISAEVDPETQSLAAAPHQASHRH